MLAELFWAQGHHNGILSGPGRPKRHTALGVTGEAETALCPLAPAGLCPQPAAELLLPLSLSLPLPVPLLLLPLLLVAPLLRRSTQQQP